MELLPEVAEYISLAVRNGFDVEKLVSASEAFVVKYQQHADKEAAKLLKKKPPAPTPFKAKGLADKVTAAHQAMLKAVTKEWVALKLECDARFDRTWRKPNRPTPPVLTGNRLEQVLIMRAWLQESENA